MKRARRSGGVGFMRAVLSPALVAVNRDVFVVHEAAEMTVGL